MKDKSGRYKQKAERATGDLLLYFLMHNMVSLFFFFIITITLGVYIYQEFTFTLILTKEFWDLVYQVFVISLVSSGLGRFASFYIMQGYYNYYQNRATKRYSELKGGINKIGLRLIGAAFLTSIVYTLGLVWLLSDAIFDETTLLPLMVIYFGLKIGIYLSVRWFFGSKT